MKKTAILFVLVLFLSGCATYKFQRGQVPYDKGYVASRENRTILEYTLGKDSGVPELSLAKERFRRRRKTVEHYYKKMGYIENRFKMVFFDPCIVGLKFMGGIFRLPAIAVSDYKYEHNPKYRKRVQQLEAEKDAREEAWINELKTKLNSYVDKDIVLEEDISPKRKVIKKKLDRTEQAIIKMERLAQQEAVLKEQEGAEEMEAGQVMLAEPAITEEKIEPEEILPELIPPKPSLPQPPGVYRQPKAVIVAKPLKGYSPLRVRFNGSKSHVAHGKIIYYQWDFGDGDTSTKANPVNTYYSGSFQPQRFTVTLTVQDDKGNTAATSTVIEVLNR